MADPLVPAAQERADCIDATVLRIMVTRGHGVVRIVFDGEVDFSALADLDTTLRRINLDQGTLVHLDLSHLRFADVAATRRLGWFARQARCAGHNVTTCGADQLFRKVATLLGVDRDMGLL